MNVTVLSALAEPTRLKMVELMRDGSFSVGEIAEKLGLGQPQTSKHLKVLADAGIVAVKPMANRRIYRLQAKPLQQLRTWIETFEQAQENRYAQLDAYLAELDD